jgi:hypothetical protein
LAGGVGFFGFISGYIENVLKYTGKMFIIQLKSNVLEPKRAVA